MKAGKERKKSEKRATSEKQKKGSSGRNLPDCFPSIPHGPKRKRHLLQFIVTAGTILPSLYLATTGGRHMQT
jgi:hypothetical protein